MSPTITRGIALGALGVIFAANFFSYLDRQLVSALEKPLSEAHRLGAGQFGFLWTLFTIGYMIFAIPIGYLADRYNRPKILAICIVVWSVATAASGFATDRWLLYVSRMLIGMGEAGCLIIGQALLADYFRTEVRGKALSIFHLAVPLGGTGAFIMAGALGRFVDWRTLFYLAAAPGILLGALILMLPDPPRGGQLEGHGHGKAGGIKEYLGLFRIPTLMLVIFAQAFAVFILVPLIHFGAKFFTDAFAQPEERVKIGVGILALVAGGLGTFLSGVIGDRLSKKVRGGYALQAGVSFLLALPCLLLGFRQENITMAMIFLGLGAFFIFMCMPAVNTQIANSTPPAQRAMAWSMAVFILHLLGDTASPVFFGAIVDARTEALGAVAARREAFTAFSFSLVAAGICCLLASRTAGRDADRAKNPATVNTAAPGRVV